MANQTQKPHEEDERLSSSADAIRPYSLFGPSSFSFSIYDFQRTLNSGYKPEDLNEWSYDLSIYYFNLANATMIRNKSASASVSGEESSPENKTVIGYLRYSKGWSEQEIQVLMEGSKDPSLLNKLTGFDIAYLSRNQLASNYLQRIINVVETAETILDRVGNRVFDLMGNHYGSFLFQRLLLSCTNKEQLDKIVCELVNESRDPSELICMATTYFGSLSIQKLFRALKRTGSSLVKDLMSFMKPGLLLLMEDNVSVRNLILDCLKQLTYYQNQAIYIAAGNNCIELAEHPDGYRVMATVVETIQEPDKMQLLNILAHHSVQLAQNPNGMLVLKKVIQLENPNITEVIFQNLKPHVVKLSMHKHGSHVIEKCLETSGMESLGLELLQSDQLPQIAKNQFGNYILNKVVKSSKIMFQYYWMHRVESALGLLQNHGNSINVLPECLQNFEEAMQGNTSCMCKRY